MMKPRVYIETSIPSYYHETRRSATAVAWREATRRWWDHDRAAYEVFASTYVLAELDASPPAKRQQVLELMSSVPLVDEPPELKDVVAYYIEHYLMPANALGDVAHLALASLHGFEYLLTWNCQHLANANKIKHLTILNARLGLRVPVITTPLTLIQETSP